MTQLLDLFDMIFKGAIIKMLQWAIMKMLKTKNRNSLQWNIKCENELNGNLEMKNTIANNSQTLRKSSTAEWREQGEESMNLNFNK